MPYKLDWAPIWDNRDLLVEGFLTTIVLSALGLLLALIIGVTVGTAGASTGASAARERRRLRRADAQHSAARAHVLLVHGAGLPAAAAVRLRGLRRWRSIPAPMWPRSCARASEPCRRASASRRSRPASRRCRRCCSSSIRRPCASSRRRSRASFSQLIKDSSLASVITVAELTYQASVDRGADVPHLRGLHHDLAALPAAGLGRDLRVAARAGRARRCRAEGERCLRSSSRTCRSC